MTDSPTKTLSLIAAYTFAAKHGLADEVAQIRGMAIDEMTMPSSVRRGYIAELLREKKLLDAFIIESWSFGKTDAGKTKLRWYAQLHARHQEILSGAQDESNDDDSADSGPAGAQAFALESQLRDFLAHNLQAIEPGLKLYSANGRSGVEFVIDGGRIDVLAVDRQGRHVVIELKLSRGRNRTLGQLLYYMGWVDTHLGGAPCRGVIVAAEISDDLRLAVKRVPGVSLALYSVSMSIQVVDAPEA